jgi:hypothetical protein
MQNLTWHITDDEKLVITVDLKQTRGFTEKFQSVRIATSNGPIPITQIHGQPDERGMKWLFNMHRPFLNDQERQAAEDARRKTVTGG